jgi:hypothetical protein
VKADTADAATNLRVDARNTAAEAILRPQNTHTHDQHAFMIQHSDLQQDKVHFNEMGAALMGDQAAAIIRQALGKPSR